VDAGWYLAAIAPIGLVDRQQILADLDPLSRLVTLAEMAEQAATMLAYRLSRG
jgi:hypothetical protein